MKYYKTQKEGFTLIETMVAITILLIAVVAPMSLAQEGISAARLAQDQIVAFYLAQEGVELVRNMRDENKLKGLNQLAGPLVLCDIGTGGSGNTNGCYIDATVASGGSFKVTNCAASGCVNIKKNDEKYTYESGDFIETKYKRTIKAWYVGASGPTDKKEVKIEVEITWPFITSTRSYTLRENLLEW